MVALLGRRPTAIGSCPLPEVLALGPLLVAVAGSDSGAETLSSGASMAAARRKQQPPTACPLFFVLFLFLFLFLEGLKVLVRVFAV